MSEAARNFEKAVWPGHLLTDCELEVARLYVRRWPRQKIASALGVPLMTIIGRCTSIYRKFNIEAAGKKRLPAFITAWNEGRPENEPRGIVVSDLTTREIEVGCLSAAGLTKWNIGDCLDMDPGVVDTHRSHAYKKLGFASLDDLVEKWPGLMEAHEVDWQNFVQGMLRRKNLPGLTFEPQGHKLFAAMG